MKRIFLALVFLASPTISAQAEVADLYCQGDAWLNSGDPFNNSMIMSLDTENGVASVMTFSGMATGRIEADPQLYTGMLHTANGKSYWMNLDRFSGKLVLIIYVNDQPTRAEFDGTCKRRERQF